MVLIGIILSFHVTSTYTVPQYVTSALITFVSAEVLEGNIYLKKDKKKLLYIKKKIAKMNCYFVIAGINLALLSNVMSSRLARGTYNGGLLSTEAGTIARVVADGTITLAGYLGEDKLLNVTLIPSLVTCIASIVGTVVTYNSLF